MRIFGTNYYSQAGQGDQRQKDGTPHAPNENKMSDGWRRSASLRVEGGISWKPRNQSCQTFAPSHS
jgi:hypothetical protein